MSHFYFDETFLHGEQWKLSFIGENWIEFIARSSMMIHLCFNRFVPFLEYLEYFLDHNHRLCFIL